MMYHSCMFYTMDKEDEIIRFDEKVHKSFEFHTDIPYDEKIVLSPEELLIANFIYYYACEVWNKDEHCPDHMVGIIITDDELSKVLHINKANVKKSIINLMEKEVIGIVLLDNNQYAYHFVL